MRAALFRAFPDLGHEDHALSRRHRKHVVVLVADKERRVPLLKALHCNERPALTSVVAAPLTAPVAVAATAPFAAAAAEVGRRELPSLKVAAGGSEAHVHRDARTGVVVEV